MAKFNWNSETGGEPVNAVSKHCALYWYCSEYHLGTNDWRYQWLSKSPYTPGPLEKDILSTQDGVAMSYFNHLVSIFEDNYRGVSCLDLAINYEPYVVETFHNIIVTGITGNFQNPQELAREIYAQVVGQCLEHFPSIVSIFDEIEWLNFNYPLTIQPKDSDEFADEWESGLNAIITLEKASTHPCHGCLYYSEESALKCAVNPLSKGRCIEYRTA